MARGMLSAKMQLTSDKQWEFFQCAALKKN